MVKLFELSIGQSLGVHIEPVAQNDLELLGADVTAPIPDLLAVGRNVVWLPAVVVTVLPENSWNRVPWFLLVILGVRVGVVVPLREVNLGVRALGMIVLPLRDRRVAEVYLNLRAS